MLHFVANFLDNKGQTFMLSISYQLVNKSLNNSRMFCHLHNQTASTTFRLKQPSWCICIKKECNLFNGETASPNVQVEVWIPRMQIASALHEILDCHCSKFKLGCKFMKTTYYNCVIFSTDCNRNHGLF